MQFFIPQDAKSLKIKDGFVKVAQKLKFASIKVGVIDCDKYEDVCASQGFRSYPAFKFYFDGKSKSFDDQSITSKAILQFVEESIPSHVVNLRLSGHIEELLQKQKMSAVYVNPEYETPLWLKSAGYRYRDKFALGEIRGPNEKLHQLLHIARAPSVHIYCGDKDALETFDGDASDQSAVLRFLERFPLSRCKELTKKAQQTQLKRKQAAQGAKRLSASELQKKRVSELRDIVTELGIPLTGLLEKEDFVKAITGARSASVEL